jgi:hypothetical protein
VGAHRQARNTTQEAARGLFERRVLSTTEGTGAIAAVERKVLLERADAARKLTSRRREALADVEADEGEVEEVVGD